VQRRERIVSDFRLGRAHRREERGFARVGKPDDARIRDELEAQPDRHFHARLARVHAARCAIGRGFEMRVAEAAVSARRDQRALAGMDKIGEKRLVVLREDLGSRRHLENHVIARGTRPVGAHAVLAVASVVMLLEAEIDQRVVIFDALGPDAPAPATVATVGSAELDKLLAPEGEAAISASSRPNVNFCLIQETHTPGIKESCAPKQADLPRIAAILVLGPSFPKSSLRTKGSNPVHGHRASFWIATAALCLAITVRGIRRPEFYSERSRLTAFGPLPFGSGCVS
jgi:hypothetical protein